tara:strand:- start:2 stop:1972 length:1971 start_codon:yes stop_codon:yes gene_type:complete
MKEHHKKESPIISLLGFGGGGTGTAFGGVAGGPKTYVDDVFAPYVYTGDNSVATQTFNTGLDMSGEGGMIWFKSRSNSQAARILDTVRGANESLIPHSDTDSGGLGADGLTFLSNGFSLGWTGGDLDAPNDYISWSFRKAPGFFDIVTWTGNGVDERLIPHNLGSTPGMIVVKCTSNNENWIVWHRNIATTSYLQLNTTNSLLTGIKPWGTNTQTINSTHFSVNNYGSVNSNGRTYVAYVFAHDDQQFGTGGNESIIECGQYTGSGSVGKTVNLGFEPQFVMVKSTQQSRPWVMIDTVRGMPRDGDGVRLLANDSAGDVTSASFLAPTPTGFEVTQQNTYVNTSGENYIYMAIRRPNKPPEAGTDVFAIDVNTQSEPEYVSNFVVDWAFHRNVAYTDNFESYSRLTGFNKLEINRLSAQSNNNAAKFDFMNGWGDNLANDTNYRSWMFKRAPGFLDIVCYNGNGSNRTINHNLGKVPEMIWVKKRESSGAWAVYHSAIGPTKYLQVNSPNQPSTYNGVWNDTAPTSTVFSLGSDGYVNGGSSNKYIAYLFSSLPGISKVGSYAGTGNNIDVDCGFASGARFVLIKATHDNSTEWFTWDSVRGIVAGNDPYLLFSSNAAQVTNTDYIDPLSTGFTVTSNAPAALNAVGGDYIFLAIA